MTKTMQWMVWALLMIVFTGLTLTGALDRPGTGHDDCGGSVVRDCARDPFQTTIMQGGPK